MLGMWCCPATEPQGSVTGMQVLSSVKFEFNSVENGVIKASYNNLRF